MKIISLILFTVLLNILKSNIILNNNEIPINVSNQDSNRLETVDSSNN